LAGLQNVPLVLAGSSYDGAVHAIHASPVTNPRALEALTLAVRGAMATLIN